MTRREAWLGALVIGTVAIAVRIWAATVITFPRPEDTDYYVGVAGNLLSGQGLVSNAIWSYGTPPLIFPRPAFEVWLPLPTFLDAIPMALLGATFRTAQWASIVEGAVVAVLATWLAGDIAIERGMPLGRSRTLSLGTGLVIAVYLPLVLHSVLPDSTMPFAALVLGVCILAGRLARDAADDAATAVRWHDRRVTAIGILLGLAALTRNEAIWLALGWAIVAWGIARDAGTGRGGWARLVLGAAVPAVVVFAPWAVRDWMAFGSPLPGQALANALSLTGRDIFAWSVPVTPSRYLGAGLPALIGLRWDGFVHNVVSVLLLPGVPIAAVGLVGLPWTGRGTALRLLVVFSITTFVMTTLLFPVSTTWGTFLHAAGAVQVLLVVSALLALDWILDAIGRVRGWTRHVAWLGPTLGIAAGILFTAALLPGFGRAGDTLRDRYAALPEALRAAGAYPAIPRVLGGSQVVPAVITDFPIYLAETTGLQALALPDEPPSAVLDLARHFPGTNLVIVNADDDGIWPEVRDTDEVGIRCFEPVSLAGSGVPALDGLRVFRITCP
ncbi:MAG: hypothetical protein HY264_08000 [Chloroflexi bacterium]|nr:hypothetical protein [Chloroflexota bacterium]